MDSRCEFKKIKIHSRKTPTSYTRFHAAVAEFIHRGNKRALRLGWKSSRWVPQGVNGKISNPRACLEAWSSCARIGMRSWCWQRKHHHTTVLTKETLHIHVTDTEKLINTIKQRWRCHNLRLLDSNLESCYDVGQYNIKVHPLVMKHALIIMPEASNGQAGRSQTEVQ